MKKWNRTTNVDVTLEQLFAVLTDPEFQHAQQMTDPAVKDATVTEVSRTDSQLVLRIDSHEYSRGLTGIDKSKTERTSVTQTFDLEARSMRWVHKGAQAERVTVEGVDRAEAVGDRARLVAEMTIEVRVPLIGKKIESYVVKEIDEGRPAYERELRQFCSRAS